MLTTGATPVELTIKDMNDILVSALFGLLGGSIRAAVGIIKHSKTKKKFRPVYLVSTLLAAAAIGAVTSISLTTNNLMNLVVGYAGIDFLESLVKIIKK